MQRKGGGTHDHPMSVKGAFAGWNKGSSGRLKGTSHHTIQTPVTSMAKPCDVNLRYACATARDRHNQHLPSESALVKVKRQLLTSSKNGGGPIGMRPLCRKDKQAVAWVRPSEVPNHSDQTRTHLGHLREETDGQGEGQAKGSEAHKALDWENHPGTGPQERCSGKERLC